jgi:hypothetical protein
MQLVATLGAFSASVRVAVRYVPEYQVIDLCFANIKSVIDV